MPLFVVDIQKRYVTEYWTNRYCVSAADLGAAETIATAIVACERAIHLSTVEFDKARVSDFNPATDTYSILTLGGVGGVAISSNQMMPLFNCVRVDFNVSGGGRPSRKYLRGCLHHADMAAAFEVTQARRDAVLLNYGTPMASQTGYVDVDGQEIIQAVVHRDVAMRQLRRGTRRRTEPVIP